MDSAAGESTSAMAAGDGARVVELAPLKRPEKSLCLRSFFWPRLPKVARAFFLVLLFFFLPAFGRFVAFVAFVAFSPSSESASCVQTIQT